MTRTASRRRPDAALTIASTEWTGGGIGRALSDTSAAFERAGISPLRISPQPGFRNIPTNIRADLSTTETLLFGTWHAALWQGYPIVRIAPLTHRWYVFVHGFELSPLTRPGLSGRAVRRILLAADGVFCNSNYLKQRLALALPSIRASFVPFGVDSEWLSPQAPPLVAALRSSLLGPRARDTTLVLVLSRLVPRKGHLLLLSALSRLPVAERPLVVIAGQGPSREAIRQAITRHRLQDNVVLLGAVPDDDLPLLYSASDVFIMPTLPPDNSSWDFEGYGLVYLEAAACGTPVIGSDVGGVRDAIRVPEMGWLVSADGGTVEELAALLCTPRDQLAERGRAAMAYVQEHRPLSLTIEILRRLMCI